MAIANKHDNGNTFLPDSDTIKILLLEDNLADAALIKRRLNKDGGMPFDCLRVETREEFEKGVTDFGPNLILADFSLPSFDGMAALNIAREKCPDVPFVFVSGCFGEEPAVEAMKMGATDYVLKDRLERLVPSVKRALREAADRDRIRQAEAREEYLRLAHDELERRVKERTEELNFHRKELEMQNRELMKMHRELEVSRNRYSDLYDFAPIGYATFDGKGIILEINLTGAKLLGMKRDYLIGRSFTCFLAGEDVRLFDNHLQRCKQIQENAITELSIATKSGETLQVQLNSVPVKDVSGWNMCYRTAIIDITEPKQAAQEKVRLERQLMQSQKMESIGLLAGGVAHDFNNLLTAISGYGQMIEEHIDKDDELLRTSIQQVLEAAERAGYLTKNLLAFSRKQEMYPRSVAINDVVRSVTRFLTRIIGEDIELRTHIADKEIFVMADTGQIDQVLINLATNARDAMPAGGHLHIAVERVFLTKGEERYGLERPGSYALVSVSDTGIGMEKEVLDKIFEPFFTTKEPGKGTGLGLSIIYGIVKQHNGAITVESRSGKGTTFKMYLPSIWGGIRQSKPCSLLPAGGTETILLVEDEEIVRKLMGKILHNAGYTVITAHDGEDAVAKFRETCGDVSLVVTDVVMPKKNGKEVYEEVRRIRPEIKVIFTSGYSADIMQEKGITDETLDVVVKPISRSVLLSKVREVLDRKP